MNSLYRKYRPVDFDSVVGHENVVNILESTLIKNNFSHAMLFTGQHGTGKTSLAKIFAKAVNCTNKDNYMSCGKCQNCLQSLTGAHPDIFEIDAASNNGVDEIRNINANVSTLPILGKYKIYIIDEVHMLSTSAFNALLKTLEEPPFHVIFILATTEYNKIPQTIISRCQIFYFQKINNYDLKKRLTFVATSEGFEVDKEVLDEICYLSEGSLRDALNNLEQLTNLNINKITMSEFKQFFTVATNKEKIDLLKAIFNNDIKMIINYFENAAKIGMDFDVLSLSLLNVIKEIIEFKITKDNSFVSLFDLNDLIEFENISLNDFFILSDELANAFSKTRGTSVNLNYLLISILKVTSNLGKEINLEIKTEKLTNKFDEKKVTSKEIINEDKINDTENIIITNNNMELNSSNTENISLPSTSFVKKLATNIKDIDVLLANKIEEDNNIHYDNIEFTDEQIINALMGSHIWKERKTLSDKLISWFDLDENGNLLHPQIASDFAMIHEMNVVAASNTEMIIVGDERIFAKWLNNKLQDNDWRNKFFNKLGKKISVIAISKIRWRQITEFYKEQISNYNLNSESQNYQPTDPEKFYLKIKEQTQKELLKESEVYRNAVETFGIPIKVVD
ncbi:DNA polymerase III subunit gamma/tau [Spiroplasma endosymbiont of Labia minor]|uniref:DNA polymerase III subunit gamma/tau n=1 Tax=Spiroplasma endosymbiont of Labia minor TaxID=3066305 RepID=UPI0030D461D9